MLTYSDPNCGYCAGTGTGYATASVVGGAWTRRGSLSALSCGGQPRDVDLIDGHVYEQIDQWYGDLNETRANTVLAPLVGMECPVGQSQSQTPAGSIPTNPISPTTNPTSSTTSPPTSTPSNPAATPRGERHFEKTLGVDFKVVTTASQLL